MYARINRGTTGTVGSESSLFNIVMTRRQIFLLLLLLPVSQSMSETTVAANVTFPGFLKSQHKFSRFWPMLSSIGVVGTILNSYVLYCFISERNNMVTSVNVMIG